MPRNQWQQHNITFADRDTARRVIVERLGPVLVEAENAGHLRGWWFMHKQPWPLRYHADTPSALIESTLAGLVDAGAAVSVTRGIYEPETEAFGGPMAMTAAHELFHRDSRHLLTYLPDADHLGRRETAVLLTCAMMRSAGLDWFEQGDVWAKVAALRPLPQTLPPERSVTLIPAMRTLLIADSHSLCRPDGPLHGHEEWMSAFETTGRKLAQLAAGGQLVRGLRAILAHHIIFHANRAGLFITEQSVLSAIAREIIMGTRDTIASPDQETAFVDTVVAVNIDADTTSTPEADRLREALVDEIRSFGLARTQAVETALRAVPRHLFVPDAPLPRAYANAPVHIKYDTDGTSISCASQPSVVAAMLDQLDVAPGDRILELGAGTGYNAALLAHLAGEHGHVTTLDVDDDLVEAAREHLAAAGSGNVEALTRDGALGHAPGAPYNRVIATVGAHGVPHAWIQQLAPGGRLLVPQRLKGSVSRSIAYEQRDGRWVSVSSQMNTFMPLRRGIADDDRQIVPLNADGTVRLQAPARGDLDADALAGVVDQPRTEEWTGVTVQAMESPEWMELFVTCAIPSGLIRMLFPQNAKGNLLADDPYPSSTAAIHGGAFTYLARRVSEQTTPDGGKLWEFGVIGHGPGSDELAAAVATAVRTWDRDFRDREATFEIRPLDAPAIDPRPGVAILDTPLNRVVVDWSQ